MAKTKAQPKPEVSETADAELDRLTIEATQDEARLGIKKDRIKQLLQQLGKKEHKTPTGWGSKISVYTEYTYDTLKAQATLQQADFERLFPRKADGDSIKGWCVSDAKNAEAAKIWRSGKDATPRLYLSAPR